MHSGLSTSPPDGAMQEQGSPVANHAVMVRASQVPWRASQSHARSVWGLHQA